MEMTPTDIAGRIGEAYASYFARQSHTPAPHDHVYASAWRTCDRRMVYELTQPDRAPRFPPEVQARILRGQDRERDLTATLIHVGRDSEPPFTVVNQQERYELRDHKGRVAITGKVDARLQLDGCRPPLEIKSWSPMLVDRIDTFADVFENPWTQSGGYQLLAYLFGSGEPFGFLLLDRSGLPRLLPVELEPHLDRMEAFLQKAERVLDHVAGGTLPDYLDDPIECRRCPWYGSTCNPPLSADVAQVLTDPELEAALERREQLKGAAAEYLDLDKQVKQQLRGVESGLAGAFQIRGYWGKQSTIVLPDALKKQYTVTNPKGRFTLEITRL